jgi:hypothetical protein
MPQLDTNYMPVIFGILLILLGCSFAYKFFLASVLGRVSYWAGFLPLTMLSPFIIHLPAGKKSLIKRTHGLWVHLIMGPAFLCCSALSIAAGFDLAGMPGVDTLNWVLNGGDWSKPRAVQFSHVNYAMSFPFLTRAGAKVSKMIEKVQIPEKENDKLVHHDGEGYNSAMSRANSH